MWVSERPAQRFRDPWCPLEAGPFSTKIGEIKLCRNGAPRCE
jgi:hypothetical protein